MIRYISSAILLALPALAFNASAQTEGEALFVEKCAMCHRDRGMGTVQLLSRIPADQARLEDRKFLPAALVKTVVRNGLGNMFSISRAEVSDPQLELIAEYLAKENTNDK